jgi:5'-3' exonuclease
MVLIDFNGIVISNIVTQKIGADENLIRHMILNSLRMYRKKFQKYGEMVIVADGGGNWRKDVFDLYKAARKKNRDESKLDWDGILKIKQKIQDEIKEHFPYRVMHVWGCEADDVIAVLTQETQSFGKYEDVIIVSSDKDFVQLQKQGNVQQFSPFTKKFIKDDHSDETLFEHIVKGDGSDGVPNILSQDDVFMVDGVRQKSVSKKFLSELWEAYPNLETVLDKEQLDKFNRNKKLIDLSEIPEDVKENIINIYGKTKVVKGKGKILKYLVKNKCTQLVDKIQEF